MPGSESEKYETNSIRCELREAKAGELMILAKKGVRGFYKEEKWVSRALQVWLGQFPVGDGEGVVAAAARALKLGYECEHQHRHEQHEDHVEVEGQVHERHGADARHIYVALRGAVDPCW